MAAAQTPSKMAAAPGGQQLQRPAPIHTGGLTGVERGAAPTQTAGAAAAAAGDGRCPSPPHEPLTWERWWGRARHLLFGPKKDADPTGVAARKDFGWLILGGSILCFVAGWVNAFAIIVAHSTVSHVTGSTTKAGMALADGDGAFIAFAFGIWCVRAFDYLFDPSQIDQSNPIQSNPIQSNQPADRTERQSDFSARPPPTKLTNKRSHRTKPNQNTAPHRHKTTAGCASF
jgi:hypothetical protein